MNGYIYMMAVKIKCPNNSFTKEHILGVPYQVEKLIPHLNFLGYRCCFYSVSGGEEDMPSDIPN